MELQDNANIDDYVKNLSNLYVKGVKSSFFQTLSNLNMEASSYFLHFFIINFILMHIDMNNILIFVSSSNKSQILIRIGQCSTANKMTCIEVTNI